MTSTDGLTTLIVVQFFTVDPFTRFVTLPTMWATLAAIAAGSFLLGVVVGIIVTWLVLLVGCGLQSQMSQPDRPTPSQ